MKKGCRRRLRKMRECEEERRNKCKGHERCDDALFMVAASPASQKRAIDLKRKGGGPGVCFVFVRTCARVRVSCKWGGGEKKRRCKEMARRGGGGERERERERPKKTKRLENWVGGRYEWPNKKRSKKIDRKGSREKVGAMGASGWLVEGGCF